LAERKEEGVELEVVEAGVEIIQAVIEVGHFDQ
jgi:hypothetical protein